MSTDTDTETIDQRLTEGVRIEFQSSDSDSHKRGRISELGDSRLEVTYGDGNDTEWINQEQVTSIVDPSPVLGRITREDVPEKPGYEREIDENVDDSLEDALKTVSVAGEDYLETLLAAELASFRIERGVFDDE